MQSGGLLVVGVVGEVKRHSGEHKRVSFLRSSWVGSKIRKNMKGKHEANDTLAVTSGVNACRETSYACV
jgi:hypothetical protein